MKPSLLFSLILTSCVSKPIRQPAADYVAKDQRSECSEFIDSISGKFKHGFVYVPKDWQNPANGRLRIFYYWKEAQGSDLDPIIMFNGGPGGASWKLSQRFNEKNQLDKITQIYIDQRGTGCSTPYPDKISTQNELGLYSSSSIVKDAEFIRKTVFKLNKWKVFGQSYGSAIVHRYMVDAPEGLSAAYAHGFAVMHNSIDYRSVQSIHRLKSLRRYLDKYPEDRALLEQLIAANKKFEFKVENTPDARNWAEIHTSFNQSVEKHKFSKNESVSPIRENEAEMSMRETVIWTIVKQEYYDEDYNSADPFGNKIAETVALKAAKNKLEIFFINKPQANPNLEQLNETNRAVLGLRVTLSSLKEKLNRFSEVKFYLYSAEYDLFSPPDTFRDEVQFLGQRIVYRNLRELGHFDYASSGEMINDILSP
ncbi:MAG: alpha/beta fold hydrolase [Bdellovibrionales bacterium]